MAIFVSEPGRPIGTRLPEVFRGQRVGTVDELNESRALHESRMEESGGIKDQAQRVIAKRAFREYGEQAADNPDTARAYMPVSRICTPALFSLPATATLAEALMEMEEHSIHHLTITADGAVAGLVDYKWILQWLFEHQKNPASQTFTHIELPAFLTVTPETDAHQLARLMLAHQLSAGLVIDSLGKPTGIVTSTDFLRLYANLSRHEGTV